MPIYCDESGGVGRGVMTLAGVDLDADEAEALLARFRVTTGYLGEVKGSRIGLAERALLFDAIGKSNAKIVVGIAISALIPAKGKDRGDHDVDIYAALLDDIVGTMLPDLTNMRTVIIDDGRYGAETLNAIRTEIAELVGPAGITQLELSHRLAGLQLADVVANTFFNRAMVNDRQGKIAAIAAPLLESGQIRMRVLESNTEAVAQRS
ncbi:MAG: DUF3800 domain-containing protein [Sphingorhabdus sp.]